MHNLNVAAFFELALNVLRQFTSIPFQFNDDAFVRFFVFDGIFRNALYVPDLHFTKHVKNERFGNVDIHARNAYHGLFGFRGI